MRTTSRILIPCLLLLAGPAGAADDKSGVDAEGFLQRWLVLAPIKMAAGQEGADALDKKQIPDEGNLRPRAGSKMTVGDKDLAWKAHACESHLLDFNSLLGAETEDSVAYAVTYVVAPEDLKDVVMKTGSDDQMKVYLNGKEVFKFAEPRPADKDQDSTTVSLRKGVNVLVIKVVNEKMDWSACVRFTDKDGKPVPKLKSQTTEKL